MNLTITFHQHGKKSKSVSTPTAELSLQDLRKLWEVEQVLNSIPGANLRVHITEEETEMED